MDERVWAEIRYLHGRKKVPVSEIARRMRLSRKTVRRALRSDTVPGTIPRKKRASKLDPYKGEIARLVKEYPHISGIRIFEEITKQGYTGKTTILNEYLKSIRQKQPEAFFRLQCAPGEQAQVDWGNCGTITVEGYSRRLSVFAMVLSYSRMLYLEFTISERIEEFLRCHVNAFTFFGGVPACILYDNLKSVVLQRSGHAVQFNPRFLDCAGFYCFQTRVCSVAKGNEKGRVESAIKYIKGNFCAGRTFKDLVDVNHQACQWRDHTANVRIHGATHKRPVDMFAHEKHFLAPLPVVEYDTAITVPVRVSKDCFVQFETNSYSVPVRYVSQKLTLKATPWEVRICNNHDVIAVHRRQYGKYQTIEDPAHFKGLLLRKKNAYDLKMRERFILLGEGAPQYLEGLAQAKVHAYVHVKNILKLVDMYGKTATLDAIHKALKHDAFGAEYIENIILQRRAQEHCTDPANTLLIDDKTGFGDVIIQEPDLTRYDIMEDTNADNGNDKEGGYPYAR